MRLNKNRKKNVKLEMPHSCTTDIKITNNTGYEGNYLNYYTLQEQTTQKK